MAAAINLPVHELRWLGEHTDGIFGRFTIGSTGLWTIERDRNDPLFKPFPPGDYICKPTYFYRGKYPTWEITGIVDAEGHVHTRVLFHKGNWEDDSEMCVVLGEQVAVMPLHGVEKMCVRDSAQAYEAFMDALHEPGATDGRGWWILRKVGLDESIPQPKLAAVGPDQDLEPWTIPTLEA